MPANTKPVFAITPRITQVFNTTANTAFDGSGTLVDLVTGATNGSKVTWVKVKAMGATTAANMIRLYISDTGGANPRLFDEITLAHQASPSSTVKTSESIVSYADLELASGQKLQASIVVGDDINFFTQVGDF